MKLSARALVLAASCTLPGTALAATYNCLPVELVERSDRFQVQCGEPKFEEGGYPSDGADRISSFAVAKSNGDFARRFESMMQTALTAGLIVQFQYTSGDTSGTAFGCVASACRTPWAFGLLAPATAVRIPYATGR
jgi:hypothetical protein